MNFDQAIFEMSLSDTGEITKAPANFIIKFEGSESGFATLKAPRYYRDKEGTIATVKRAWECFCRGDEDKLYGITSISIDYEGAADGKANKNKRLTA